MNLKTCFLTNNECYKKGQKITPKGFMLHSTGANNPNLKRYVQPNDGLLGENTNNNDWNQFRPGGRQVCVHGFIGKLADGSIATYQTLPWDMRGWHAGGSANNSYIGVEICEDDLTDVDYFNKVYQEAVELVAYLVKKFNWEVNSNTIICHSEGHLKGIASNHSDVMHWFPKHGKSMDTFRDDVAKLVGQETTVTEPVQETPSETSENEKSNIKSDGKINCIYDIQEYLNRIYGTNLALDDIYGPKTKSAVIKGYQIELNRQFDKGIAEDGIWGPKTKSASINVKQGASGRITYLIQMALFIKGYIIEIDGKFGSDTARIVAQFQKDNGLTVDKIVGKNTFEKLFN